MATAEHGAEAEPDARGGGSSAEALDLTDLLIPFAGACREAVRAAAAGEWLDASLLAGGASQVIEDHLHRSDGLLDRVVEHLEGATGPAGAVRAVAGAGATGLRRAHRARPGVGRLLERRDALLALAVDLAGRAATGGDDPALARRTAALLGPDAGWPAVLADRVLRLPSALRSFDQHPADVATLVEQAAQRWPDRDLPMLVVGVRTSGSYLGPMAAAALVRRGYRRVELITLRAAERLDRSQAAAARRARGGRVLVIDDPPVSGGAIAGCARAVEAAGVPADRVALLLPLPDGWPVAPVLRGYERIVLWGTDWHIAETLGAERLGATTDRLLAERGERLVGALEPTDDPVPAAPGGAPRTPREHRRAAYRGRVAGRDGRARTATVVAQGVGIGLFGRHDLVVARRLGGLVPDVLGVDDGVLVQLLEDPPEAVAGDPPTPGQAAAYVLARHRALPAARDRTEEMRGRKAVWEVAAMLVGGALGRADLALRIPLLSPLVRGLLVAGHPSIVDGRMSADRFLLAGPDGHRVKADFGDGAFSNRDLWSYDPIYDLAAIADDLGAAQVREAWAAAGGDPIDPSRWLLLRWVAAWDRHRHGGLPQPDYGRALGRALVDHVGELYLAVLPAARGPWVATDVDGVLETGVTGEASAPGRLGAEALRALVAHGYRVVPATGRSAGEVAERIRAWGLPAGIAEYGSVLVVGDERHDLRTPEGRTAVERARAWLAARDAVHVDPAYRFCVRAWRPEPGRSRGPLSGADIEGAIAIAGGALVAVAGEDQTDLVAAGCSKHAAVRALLARLDPDRAGDPQPLALAVGDGPADIGLLALGRRSVAPAHAASEVLGAAGDRVAGSYQAGFAEAVALLVGHAPGACPVCAPSDLLPAQEALVTALSVREAGGRGVAPRLGRLAVEVRRAPR
jgi:hydroxymethylpyrimidine pyrophosphatase-like HAD family hydrolase/adenine/guanine phosphoribosyltransferase-like PRPP-binding protein